MLRNIKWAWSVLWSDTYVIATDKKAVCNINTMDPYSMKTITTLSAQRAAVEDLRDRLDGLIEEHDNAMQLMTSK